MNSSKKDYTWLVMLAIAAASAVCYLMGFIK